MKVVKADGGWMLDVGPHLVAMTCPHKKTGTGACGGCYARAIRALQAIGPAGGPVVAEFFEAVKADAK